jgi:hypothetical protein
MWKHGRRLLHTLAAVAMGAAGGALLWAQTTITGPGPMTVGTTNATDVNLVTNNTARVIVSSAGHLLPAVNNVSNLGSSTLQWGSAWLGGNLSVGGSGSITGSLSVGGNGSITGNLSVSGSTVTLSGIPGGSTATDVLVRTGTGNVQYRAASGLVGTYAWLLGGNTLTSVQTLGTLSNHDLPIITAGTEKVRITTAGNVGIGTSAPAQKLHVVGNVQFTGALMPAGAAGSTGQVLVSQGAGTAPQWWTITDDGSGTVVVTPAGGQITIGALNNNAIWNADRLQGNNVSSTMPMADQVLAWDGVANEWQPKSLSAGTGITITGLTIAAQNTNPIWNADQLQSTAIDPGLAPNPGEVLAWDGTNNWWTATPLSSLISVATQYPIVGDGSVGNPIRFANGTASDQVWMWDGSAWVLQDRCSGCTNLSVVNDISAGGNITAGGDVNVGGNLVLGGELQAGNGAGNAGQVLVSQGAGAAPEWWYIVDDATTTTVSIGGGQIQIAANNVLPIWNAGQIQGNDVSSAAPNNGDILVWNAGTNQWEPNPVTVAGAWGLTGNGGTNPAFNFLGTTDDQPVIIKTNGVERMRISNSAYNGYVGIGDVDPAFRLELPNLANPAGRGRANSWLTYSSMRWKEEIRPIENALERVMQLRGYHFRWKPEYGGTEDIGFLAEEVARVVPEVVSYEPDGQVAGMDYSRLTALLVEALKQQQREIAELRSLVEQLLRQNGERGAGSQPSTIQDAWLGQNIPNPFAGTTTIPYYIPAGVSRAELVVRDVGGRELRRLELAERGAHGQVVLEMGLMGSGTYEYALVLDGRVVAVKQMTLVR